MTGRSSSSAGDGSGRDGTPPKAAEATDPEARARRLELDNQDLRFEIERLRASLARNQAEALSLAARCADAERTLDAIHRSTSWRITGPLRRALGALRRRV